MPKMHCTIYHKELKYRCYVVNKNTKGDIEDDELC